MIDGDRLRALIQQWRENANHADRCAAEHDARFDGANSHAFRKERRIWTTCADELEAALAPADATEVRPGLYVANKSSSVFRTDADGRTIPRLTTFTTRPATPEPEDPPT